MQQCLPQRLTGPRAAGLDCWAPGVASLGLKRPSAPKSPWRPSAPAPTPVLQRPEELVCGIHPGVPPSSSGAQGSWRTAVCHEGQEQTATTSATRGGKYGQKEASIAVFPWRQQRKTDDLGIWGAIGWAFWGTWGWQRRSSLQCTRSLNLPDPGYFRVTVPLLSAKADLVI